MQADFIVLRGLQNVDGFVDDMCFLFLHFKKIIWSLRQVLDRLRSLQLSLRNV